MGQIIKYTDRGRLVEHPFLSPQINPTPVELHSFLFPGDEIVFCHGLTLPGDGNVSSINSIQLISAKVSLIAIKPQVYSEEYTEQYQSTRTFILDTFETIFDNSNAPVILFGADGYAPFMNLSQDRNWRLPPGDFRRQIKFFTEHTGGTSSWKYNFYFPVIFGYEYWKALATASNDFYNTAQPQNGLNKFWYHYFTTAWKIRCRLDLVCLVNGVQTIIRNDHDLTPGTDDVRDYSSNPDWTTKSIKTAPYGGTPSNVPALVYGNRETEVWGYFTKVTPWALPHEQADMSAVVWIEPFEGAGTGARTRGSSLYPITPESVFTGLSTSITDDSGTHITDGTGNYIVTDGNGNGAMILFSGITPLAIRVLAIIDHNKLAAAYPGVTKFTLYVRIYDSKFIIKSTIAITKTGEELKQDAILVSAPDLNALCQKNEPDCPFVLDVFADKDDADDLKNDKSEFYSYGDALVGAVAFTLQKNKSACGDGTWEDKVTFVNSLYGLFFAFGKKNDFSGANFTDDYNKRYTGLFLEWRKIYNDVTLGVGMYRMKVTKTDVFGISVDSYDPRVFCLKKYTCDVADGTVRLEVINQGLRGTLDNNDLIDYQGGWGGQIRLKGIIYADKKPNYIEEYMQYGESRSNEMKPYIAELRPKVLLDIKNVPGWMDRYLENYFLLADSKKVTDYNVVNINPFVKFPVINDGGIEYLRDDLVNQLSSCRISLAFAQNNLRMRRSQ